MRTYLTTFFFLTLAKSISIFQKNGVNVKKEEKMRKILFIFIFVPSIMLAQWEKWEPWVTEIGIVPYAEINYGIANSDSLCDSLNSYYLKNGGADLKVAMQVCLPPFYTTWGFSNLFSGFLLSNPDTVFSPIYANWRVGTQLTYEDITTYDVSLSFLKNLGGDVNYMSLMLELGYGRQFPLQMGALQILGTAGGGMIQKGVSVEDSLGSKEIKRNETLLKLSVGTFWRTPYIVPYLYTGVSSPITDEFGINYFIAFGAQLIFPNSYVNGIPDISYPKTWIFPE